MRSLFRLLCVACAVVALAQCAPAPAALDAAQPAIAPENDKEIIEIVNLGNFGQSDRDKRSLAMLRQLFPSLAEVLDNIIQQVTRTLFSVFGRAILSQGLGGGGGGDGDSSGGGGGRVSISLPTFPPDEDDEESEEEEGTSTATTTSTTTTTTTSTDSNSNTSGDDDNSLSGSESQNSEVRVKFEDDQETAASNGGPSPVEDAADADDADRNKRFLPFGGGDAGHGGSGGGSGNFLFDIIRSTADRAARAAGTVYRMVAGTESLGLGLTATSTSTRTVLPSAATQPQLVAGSGATGDDKGNAPAVEVDVAKGADGYTEGIPGPITRLFVIANRGIANLVQDLILRLAQTSERIVNFKARLITALI